MLSIPVEITKISSRWTMCLNLRMLPAAERSGFVTSYVASFIAASKGKIPDIERCGDVFWCVWHDERRTLADYAEYLSTIPATPGLVFDDIRGTAISIRYEMVIDPTKIVGSSNVAQA